MTGDGETGRHGLKKLPLSKQLIFAAIVGGVTFVISALLGALTARVPASEHMTPTWFTGLLFGAVAGVVYLMVSGNRAMPLADDATRAAALAGPGGDAAQLLVVRRGYVGKLAGVDVLVDGVVATQLKSPRFAALRLAPGSHEVVATVQGKATSPQVIDLAAGETAVIRIDMAIGRAQLVREPDVAALRRVLADVPMIAAT